MPLNFLAAPQTQMTERLLIRRPRIEDAEQVFSRYASDAAVTRYLGWPTHIDVADTRKFLLLAQEHWERKGIGPLLVFDRQDEQLLGGTGLELEDNNTAATGYVFARSAWGKGYATETMQALLGTARQLRLACVYALCHPDHEPSIRVLEKCGFHQAALLQSETEFPNLAPGVKSDVKRFEIQF